MPSILIDNDLVASAVGVTDRFYACAESAKSTLQQFEVKMNDMRLFIPVNSQQIFFGAAALAWFKVPVAEKTRRKRDREARLAEKEGRAVRYRKKFRVYAVHYGPPQTMMLMQGAQEVNPSSTVGRNPTGIQMLAEAPVELIISAIPHLDELTAMILRDMKRAIDIAEGKTVEADLYQTRMAEYVHAVENMIRAASGHADSEDDDDEDHTGHGCPKDPTVKH